MKKGCEIYDTRPKICKEYPKSQKHAESLIVFWIGKQRNQRIHNESIDIIFERNLYLLT